MQSLVLSANIVAPMFCLILLGALIVRLKFMNGEELSHLNRAVYYVFAPIMLFNNLYGKEVLAEVNLPLLGFAIAAVVLLCLLSFALVLPIEKRPEKRGVMIQCMFRSNFVIMGMPLMSYLFPGEADAMTALLLATVVPVYNVLSVITLEFFRGGKIESKRILLNLCTNPLIIGTVCGLAAALLHVKLPAFLESAVSSVSKMTSPLFLVIAGTFFQFSDVRANIKQIAVSTAVRLIVFPGIVLVAAVLLGFRNMEIALLVTLFASPVAINSFSMAEQMGADAKLASDLVVTTTACSCFTLTFWIVLSRQLGLL